MPQAPQRLRDKFEHDGIAHDLLTSHGFTCGRDFCYRPPKLEHILTDEEIDAIDYLCYEWDYGYEHKPA